MKLFILLSLLYFAESFNFSFEKNNKCGCNLEYSCHNCAPCEKLTPLCQSENKKFQNFDANHLEDCRNWDLLGYNVELVNKVDGTIGVTFFLSPLRRDVQYEVELHILDDLITNPMKNVSAPVNHSLKTLRILGRKTSHISCQSVVSFNFSFVFSGTYQLSVTQRPSPRSVSSACLSKPFNISSFYKKNFLNDLAPSFFSKFRPQSHELYCKLHFGNFPSGLQPISTVVKLKSKIDLSLNDCSGSGNEVAKYILHASDGICCDSYGDNQSFDVCPCKFSEGFQTLTCTLPNVSTGDYCIVVGFYDPRCRAGTFWTKGASAFCMWSYNITLMGNETSIEVLIPIKDSATWPIIALVMFLGSSIFASILVFLYKPKCVRKLRLDNYGRNSFRPQSSESPSLPWFMRNGCDKGVFPEVLLLYPRDCYSFMNAMAEFRLFLKNNSCKVYDPWDDEMYNAVVESCESWSLPFITKENVKIILVLSECSKRFEEAFLNKSAISYKEQQSLDIIFAQSLSAIHQYFCNRYDSYRRIFVIQLEGSAPTNFEFITPGTVYSVPQNIECLIRDILRDEEQSTQLIQYQPVAFLDAVAEYKFFKQAHSDYLNELLSLRSV